jgi:hypothetical protein
MEQAINREKSLERLKVVANLMDAQFSIAGIKFGFDAIVGLLPIAGDLAAAVVSLYIVWEAYRIGAPVHLLLHMVINVVIDVIAGSVPLVGDAFDVMWKVNKRNVRLLERYFQK